MPRDYDKELADLANRLNKADGPKFAEGASRYQEQFGRLTSLYLMYRYVIERGIAQGAPAGVRILYAKVGNCLIGVLRLLEAGLPGPAAMLHRSLFETAVHLQVILKENVEERSKLFQDYIVIQRDGRDDSSATEAQRIEQAARLKQVRANYHPEQPYCWCWKIVPSQRNRKGIPNNPSLKELCSHMGHPEWYDMVYGDLSAAIHPDPSYETWLLKEDGTMEVGSHFGPQVRNIAEMSLAHAGHSLVQIIDYLQPEDAGQLALAVAIILGADPAEIP